MGQVPAPLPDDALCLTCNYALRGLTSPRCPECGRPFDPDQPLTFNQGRPLDRWSKLLLRPIGRWAPIALWSLAALGVLGPAWLIPSRGAAICWLLLWIGFLIICWLRSTLRAVVVRNRRQPAICLRIDDPFRRRTRRVFAFTTLLVMTRAPFLVAMLVSRPWLDSAAHYTWAVLPGNVEPPQHPRLCGLIMVHRTYAGPNQVTFHFFGGGTIDYYRTPDGTRITWDWDWWYRKN